MEPNIGNSRRNIIVIVVVVAILIIAIFLGAYLSNKNSNSVYTTAPLAENQSQTSSTSVPEQTINVKHQYLAGMHTYVGTIDVPTPCDSISDTVSADPLKANSYMIAFLTVPSNVKPGTPCADVITSIPFKVTFPGSADATVVATLNGNPIIMNLFEIPAGQDINSAIYLKG